MTQASKTILLMMVMLVVAYAGYNIHLRDGLEFRFPEPVRRLLTYQYPSYKEEFREASCDLLPYQHPSEFADCGVQRNTSNRTLFLWGDSHAAHLYVGLKNRYEPHLNIIQRTASNCPPLVGIDYRYLPHCRAMNDETLKLISKEKPDVVILSADWILYDWRLVQKTIDALHTMGIKQIDLVGPSPHWVNRITKQMYINNRLSPLGEEQSMSKGLDRQFLNVDQQMSEFAGIWKVNYISIAKALCGDKECLFRTGPNLEQLIYFDESHFTKIGSQYVISHFPSY